MTEQSQQRFNDLHNVLGYCTAMQTLGKTYVFTTNERICINQERGAIFSQDAFTKSKIPIDQIRTYTLPAHIEMKVRLTLQKIKATDLEY